MGLKKTKKRKKSSRYHGRNMGTCGTGARKKSQGSGQRDGINVGEIQEKYKSGEVNLSSYKILGDGEIRNKFIITAQSASKSAIKKVEAAGGKIIVKEIIEMKTPLVEYNRKKEKKKWI